MGTAFPGQTLFASPLSLKEGRAKDWYTVRMLYALMLLLAPSLAQEALPAPDYVAEFGEVSLPTLEPESVAAWHDYLQPTGTEAGFEAIEWQPTFADGLRAANQADRPLLLWVMNGHPLGCT